ncbi:hypothetical protein, partial [Staphylococcus aureus]|uniref:hypothetical protein n=1 Tax=Staphylococcus aureus TaxID=1280 RepID=UPI0038B3F130
KQWLQLLQIENFCLQLNNKDGLPWSPYKGRPIKKKGQRKAGKRDSRPSYEFSKGIVAFAFGLGLAGAGLLLGWTMG